MIPSFLKKVNDVVTFIGDGELIYYIPESYFDNGSAVVKGEYVDTMGIFAYDVFTKSGKHNGLKNFYFPSTMTCKPTSMEKIPDFELKKGRPRAYRLLHFTKGAEVICSTRVPMHVHNAEIFMTLLKGGKLPENIPYDKLYEYVLDNASLNGFSYKINAQIIGAVISELCRDPKNADIPFRLTPMKDMTDYKFINMVNIPKHTSAYTAITSQNADECIAAAMTNDAHKESPLEKVMMN